MTSPPPKRLYLIAGSSATGKTTRARSLARELDAGWLQADTIWRALQAAFPEGSPEYECLQVDEAIRQGRKSPEELTAQHISAAEIVWPALTAAIAFELRTTFDTLVVDGAWLLPALMASLRFEDVATETRGVLLHEPDADEVKRAMRTRWSAVAGPLPETLPRQRTGAQVSWLYGSFLHDRALAHNIPIVPARPRETLRRRVREALGIGAE